VRRRVDVAGTALKIIFKNNGFIIDDETICAYNIIIYSPLEASSGNLSPAFRRSRRIASFSSRATGVISPVDGR
jgi:hypothetical protein